MKSIEGKGVLQAYVLAHEGVTEPRSIGEGNTRLSWGKKVIQALAQAVKAGTKFFSGHGVTNSHDGRISLGEVVASTLKTIGGKLSNIVIGHFPDGNSVAPLDVVSMESVIHTEQDNETVHEINEVSGIAMGCSDKDSPAFPGAHRLAAIQCFAAETEKPLDKGEKKQMTFEEVKAGVAALNVHPHQLFTEDDMKKDNTFGKLYDTISTLEVDNKRVKDEFEELDKSAKESIRKGQLTEAKGKLEGLFDDSLTDKQKKFITNKFKPESIEDLSEDGLKGFIENSKKEFSEVAKLFGDDEGTLPKPPADSQNSGDGDDDPVEALLKKAGA